jgi:hypothetical protein
MEFLKPSPQESLKKIHTLLLQTWEKITRLLTMNQSLTQSDNRVSFWKLFNGKYFNTEIHDIGLEFNKMIWYIEHPEKTMNAYIETWYPKDKEKVRFTDIINEQWDCEPVYYKQTTAQFFQERCWKEETISRQSICDYAAKNQTTWPTAFVEYIMLMLMGYVILDDGHDVDFSRSVKEYVNTFFAQQWANNLQFPIVSIKREIENNLRWIWLQDDFLWLCHNQSETAIKQTIENF